MIDIQHRIGVRAPIDTVYRALATQAGLAEWIGTEIRFELLRQDGLTIVRFGHLAWREAVEFTAHCSMKWATFLLSLRDYVETGHGRPAPGDLKIDNWN